MNNANSDTRKKQNELKFSLTHQGVKVLPNIKKLLNIVIFIKTELNLSGNCFTEEIKELFQLKLLKKLNLESNHIQMIWNLPTSLESLNLSCNHIKSLNGLEKLENLLNLDLSCNIIDSLRNLESLNHLQSLYLGYNILENIEPIKNLKTMIEIDMEHNLLNSLSNFMPLIESSVIIFIIKNNPFTM